ncbi:Stf0 family sulfotransferase [Pararhodobacter sp. SW119]|uniref:Stf0 family sulfotransferase n=1 Tax=Pararhodobacter sp. SW119 TaxID=2780075 RepID=UPI001ADF84EF|nr:Stf0 family sulfotransferase [Pararhodobacter sp. SW119]
MDSYIICSTPRTGSTLLCDLLTSTGSCGAPDSFFMGNVDPAWAEYWGLPELAEQGMAAYAAAYLKAAIRAGTGETGIFGLRLMHRDLAALTALIEAAFPDLPSDRDRFTAAFGRTLFIHLSRQDKLAQAVSMVRAEQTGLWHIAPDGREVERLGPPRAPQYDFHRIAVKRALLKKEDAAWTAWFAAQGIVPLRIGYEGFATEPAPIVAGICRVLGIAEPRPGQLSAGVAKMADDVSHEWIRRYRRDDAAGAG